MPRVKRRDGKRFAPLDSQQLRAGLACFAHSGLSYRALWGGGLRMRVLIGTASNFHR
jgi:hypothetical protein